MKGFVRDVLIFTSILLFPFVLGLKLPPTPRALNSLLLAEIDKEALLAETQKPRIIFVGGSNLSFGLDSQTIKDSLGLNPINTAIHASIGLIYMMNNVLPHIQNGDLIILAPEYEHFKAGMAYGREELLRTIFDIESNSVTSLNPRQWKNVLPYIPKYVRSKFRLSEYNTGGLSRTEYERYSFNKFGDSYKHWGSGPLRVKPFDRVAAEVESEVVKAIKCFDEDVRDRGGRVLLTYPCLQSSSLNNMSDFIKRVEEHYKSIGVPVLGSPQRYQMPDSLIFNTPYHLVRHGALLRTKLLIQDLRPYLTP
jgi:hypothetical protein